MPVESTTTTITHIPSAELIDIFGQIHNIRDTTAGRVSVIFFSCNHCPYVQWVEEEVGKISREYPQVKFIAICSNDTDSHPEDDVSGLQDQVSRARWTFPYLIDSSQKVAAEFGAVCTPDFFVFDVNGKLVYRGALDSSRPSGNVMATGTFLRQAIAAATEARAYSEGRPSLGCGIKWRET